MSYKAVSSENLSKDASTDSSSARIMKLEISEKTLFYFTIDHPLRRRALKIVSHKMFDRFILIMIALNSLLLGIADYSHVDSDGVLVASGSWRNQLIRETEVIFTAVFTFECVIKIFSLGLYSGNAAYLRDRWNWLDFLVVVTGLAALVPGIPNISVIRTFRVLRPLKSISSNPGLQKLVVAILKSIPQLVGVLVLLFFVFVLFGIAGIQIFSGPYMHTRCRLTPYPVNLSWTVGQPFAPYRCLHASNFDTLTQGSDYSKESSPWHQAQDCFWPIDEDDKQFCSFTNTGLHDCYHDTQGIPESAWRWCGSNYDALGNPRFKSSFIMESASYIEELNWGYTNFDNLGNAFITIFQSITLEGWVVIMYQTQDSLSPIVGATFFILLVLFGSFFVLNLLLAVLEDNFVHTPASQLQSGAHEALLRKAINFMLPYDIPMTDKMREIRQQMRDIVENPYFSQFVIGLIIINTITLAMDHYPIDTTFEDTLDAINFILTLMFTIEMFLKLIALGLLDYFKEPFNVFDMIIVIVSFVELVLSPPRAFGGNSSPSGAISAMRSFRLFRIFKVVSKWTSMKKLLAKVVKTVFDLGNFGLLLLLFLYIYALIGMQFFANRLRFDENGYPIENINSNKWENAPDHPRSNFDDFVHSFGTVFQILTSEDWNRVMYNIRRSSGVLALVYPCSLIMFGNYIFMNLFLAILLGNFASTEEEMIQDVISEMANSPRDNNVIEDNAEQVQQPPPVQRTFTYEHAGSPRVKSARIIPMSMASAVRELGEKKKLEEEMQAAGQTHNIYYSDGSMKAINVEDSHDDVEKQLSPLEITKDEAVEVNDDEMPKNEDDDNDSIGTVSTLATETVFPLTPNRTLGIFGPKNPIRSWSARIVAHPRFDHIILFFIVVSSITLAIDNPLLDPESRLARALAVIDLFLTLLFALEMVIKVIALGFVGSPTAYLRNSWNVLDFIVVVISIISTFTSANNLKALRSLRALRGLRPLRVINRAPGLKIVVNAMFASIPDVMNVAAVCFLFFLIFSIFGVNYFKGTLRSCHGSVFTDVISQNDDYLHLLTYPQSWNSLSDRKQEWFGPNSNVTDMDCSSYDYPSEPCCSEYATSGIITSRMICECWGGSWGQDIDPRFDNIIYALLTFFQMSTTEGWVDIMYALVDTTGIDMQPIRDNSPQWIFFSIFFMLVGSYLAMNLFVGVVIDNFNKMRAKVDGNLAFLTPQQQEWIKTQEIARRLKPQKKQQRPEGPMSGFLFDVSFHPWFEWFIMWCIIFNTIVMGMQYFGQPTLYGEFLDALNLIFAAIFTVEMLVKVVALRARYFSDSWNRFDFAVVVGTNIGLIFLWVSGSNVGLTVTILRSFRIARLLRLMNGTESINQLFNTLLMTLPGLGNIAALLFLLFFIYAVMGVQLFAKVQYNNALNEHANFRDFGTAMISLLRFSTGENWDGFMYDTARHMNGCVNDPPYNSTYCGFNDRVGCEPLNGCGNPAIFPYMLTFTLTVTFVFLNLFIGVILEGFQNADDSKKAIKPEDFIKFADHWAQFDPTATCYITVKQLEHFIQTLYAPLGFGAYVASEKELNARISKLNLHIFHGNKVHFKDVLTALSTDAMRRMANDAGTEFTELPYAVEEKTKEFGVGTFLRRKKIGPDLRDHIIMDATGRNGFTMQHYYAVRRIEFQMKRLALNMKKRRAENERMLAEQKAKEAEAQGGDEESGEKTVVRGESRRDNVMTFREETSAGRNPLSAPVPSMSPTSEDAQIVYNGTASPNRDILMDVGSDKAPSTSLASPTTIAQRQGSEWMMQQNGLAEADEAEKSDSTS